MAHPLDDLEHMDEDFLTTVGKVWTDRDIPPGLVLNEEVEKSVDAITALLADAGPKSILLTGEPGVGKSSLVQLASGRLLDRGWGIFVATAGNLMAGQRYIGDLERRVQDVLSALVGGKKNYLWIVPRFQELYYGGRHEYSPVSILDHILPAIAAGELQVVGEVDANELEKILQFRPQILNHFEIVRVQPSDRAFTLRLARDWMASGPDRALWEGFSEKDLEEVYYLAKQYLTQKENPGCLLDLLKQTKQLFQSKNLGQAQIGLSDFVDSLANITGMPKSILDDAEKLDLEEIKQYFSTRIIGQDEAVRTVVERIAMIKAGLTDPSKPAGVFLFVGPTGTGKTEVAKSLAEFLFGSEDSLIRLDMSEFQTADAIYKILGGASDIAESAALVNTIRKKPFSIVLLDEFEKAHAHIWDLFLQVFDDGRLTDQRGAVADFRHCIIILTSNLGASIPASPRIGYTPAREDIDANVLKSIEQTFRPEFVNRIDRIVVFKPLTKAVAKMILKNELKKVLNRRGLRRKTWEIDFEDSALEFLLDRGFSKALGARPLKRSVEKYLLAPLALTIVNHDFPKGNQFLLVSAGRDKLKVDFIDPDEPEYSWEQKKQILRHQREVAGALTLKQVVADAKGVLSEFEVIQQALERVKAHLAEAGVPERKEQRMDEMADPGFWSSPERYQILTEVEFLDRFESALESAQRLFERLDSPGRERLSYDAGLLARLAQKIYLLDTALEAYTGQRAQDALLRVQYDQEEEDFGQRVERMYRTWAKARGMRMERLHHEDQAGEYSAFYSVYGFGAFAILEPESGYHVLEGQNEEGRKIRKARVRVSVIPVELDDYRSVDVPSLKQRMAALPRPRNVRKFREGKSPLVKDLARNWQTGKLDFVLNGHFDLL